MMTEQSYLLGVDLGAGSLKASVLTGEGVVLGDASAPVSTSNPKFGWAEQNPEEWYQAFRTAVPKALRKSQVTGDRLSGIGISGGAHIQVLTDAKGEVVRPAILWSDQRSAGEASELHELAGELIIRSSLNQVNPTWTLPQLLWLKRHEPDNIARVHRLFLSKDYLRFRVTGDWHTDFSDVVGALMADVKHAGWSQELCDLLGWRFETLPPVAKPTDVVGAVSARAAQEAGLVAGTPVVAGSNDTTVELFGAGALNPGQGAIKLATAAVLYRTTEGPVINPPVSCYPHILPGMYYTATGTNSCASAHRWLRDEFFSPYDGTVEASDPDTFSTMDRLASAAPPGSEGLIFHPYLQGERGPYWDPRLRADFIGITMHHGRAHFVRALYEGIAFSVRDLLESSGVTRDAFSEIRLLGGGARSSTWRQVVSDVLGMEVLRPTYGDASFGAGLLAGVGVGTFASARDAIEQCVHVLDHCAPNAEHHALYSELFSLYKDAQAALAPISHKLHDLGLCC